MSSLDKQTYQNLVEPQPALSQSTLVLILPPVIRNRLPLLTSIRRRYMSCSHNTEHANCDLWPLSSSLAKGELTTCRDSDATDKSGKSSRAASNDSSGTVTPREPDASGINWNLANAGVRLWLARKQQLEENRNADPALMRSMHIDALKYMHAALPNDLTPAEIDAIIGSLPRDVRDELAYREHVVVPNKLIAQRNFLRKAVSDTVCSLIAVLIFVLPFVVASFNKLLRYEREHQISQKMLISGVGTVYAFGERGLDLKNSRLGCAILGAAVWMVDGIVGGVKDGLVRSTVTVRPAIKTSL